MFRSPFSKRYLPAVAAASGLLTSSVTPFKSKSECEEVTVAPYGGQHEGSTRRPFRVLIVGSGLTGCLTALRIRQRLHDCQQPPSSNHHFDLTVVERATYPAGRFGATATYRGCVADIGAQVLSTINPKDPRALGGHGVTVEDIRTSSDIVQALTSDGTISRVMGSTLGETEERMLWEGLWQHYSAPRGLVSVLRKLLLWATARTQFGVRVDSLSVDNDSMIQVKGVQRIETKMIDINVQGGISDNGQDKNIRPFIKSYDCVVLCIPAPNVLELGVASYLSPMSMHVLENVRYDRRTCEAHFFSKEITPRLAKVFGQKTEIMLDDDDEDGKDCSAIQYISWQNPKRNKGGALSNDGLGTCCTIVAHGKAGKLLPLDNKTLDSSLTKLIGLPEEEILSLRLHSKQIPWNVSQLIMPMEAVVADPPSSPAWQCIVGEKGSSQEGIIVAGDFMTQSSFVGCVASADAAARAVVERYTTSSALYMTPP